MALSELLRKAQMEQDVNFLREGVRVLGQALMELEVSQQVGAERYERTLERTNQRNGYRDRSWDTRVGTIQLKVPKMGEGSFYPSLLDPRKRAERALAGVVQEAYVQPDPASAREQWQRVAQSFQSRFPRLAQLMDDAEADVLAYLAFLPEHWRQLWSTNPLSD
jgi:transposase-like protein